MAWTAPTSRTTGDLMTASIWNTDLVNNLTTLRGGGIAISSQAALDFIFASSTTQLGRLAAGSALQYPRINAAGNGWEFATLTSVTVYDTLLIAAGGTSTTTSANNLSTVAISGLTALDQLFVSVWLEQTVQDSSGVDVYNSTDSVSLDTTGALTAPTYRSRFSPLQQARSSNVKIFWRVGANFQAAANTPVTVTTPWTGSWTLALRSNGMTSGGSLAWSWAVHKRAGQ